MRKWVSVLISGLLLRACTTGLIVESKSVIVRTVDKSKVRIEPVSEQIIRASADPEGKNFSTRHSLMIAPGELPPLSFEYAEEDLSVMVNIATSQNRRNKERSDRTCQ